MIRLWNDQIFISDEYVKGHKSPSPDKVNLGKNILR